MYSLAYESTATRSLDHQEMEALLVVARDFNEQHGITGCLISYKDTFVQILEGDEDIIRELYARIQLDARHMDVETFSQDTIEDRNFPTWGMAYYPIGEDVSEAEYLQFRNNLLLMAEFSEPTHMTSILFWRRIKHLIAT